jgi:hypothetical protein
VGAPVEQPAQADPEHLVPTATPQPPTPQVIGPFAGEIPHLMHDDDAERYEPGITTKDFYASGNFVNPCATTQKGWSIGYWLRVERREGLFWNRGFAFPAIENRGIVVAVASDGRWEVFHRMAAFAEQGTNINDIQIASGYTGDVNTVEGEENVLSVSVNGDAGILFLNGRLLAEFDMSSATGAGDVVPVTGIFADDEFANVSTNFHSLLISQIAQLTQATADSGLGQLSAGAMVTPFAPIDGDFFATLGFPVAKPTFSGPWSWSVEVRGQGENVRISVSSDQRVTVVHETADSSGAMVAVSVYGGPMAVVNNVKDTNNRLLVTLVDGRLEFMINGYSVAGVELNKTDARDLSVLAFVRGEPGANDAVVTLGNATLWQPAEQGAATE